MEVGIASTQIMAFPDRGNQLLGEVTDSRDGVGKGKCKIKLVHLVVPEMKDMLKKKNKIGEIGGHAKGT